MKNVYDNDTSRLAEQVVDDVSEKHLGNIHISIWDVICSSVTESKASTHLCNKC